MKNEYRQFLAAGLLVMAVAVIAVPARAESNENSTKLNHVGDFIADKDGNPFANPTLYESRGKNSIVAPDGHQLTLAEFNSVQGTIAVKCTSKGTRTTIHLNGLIPNGVYTIWLVVFGKDASAGSIAVGSLGANDGSANSFQADEDGAADITATNSSGALSARGNIGACWLTDEAEVRILGAYHLDGATHGTSPGPAGTFVEQFVFSFKK